MSTNSYIKMILYFIKLLYNVNYIFKYGNVSTLTSF